MYKQRQTYWIEQTNKARNDPYRWLMTSKQYTAVTAKQLCSDIRHGRRIKGMLPGEVWEAEYFWKDDDEERIMCTVLIKCTPNILTLLGATPAP